MSAVALLSVFLIALPGGVYCLAICSGIVLVVECGTAAVWVVSRRRLWLKQVVMHAGRLTTYAPLSVTVGATGVTFWRQQQLPTRRGLFALTSVLLLTYRTTLLVRSAGDARYSVWLERLLGHVAGGLPRGATTLDGTLQRQPSFLRRYITGMAWGLVPRGMVYGALVVALLAGNATSRAAVMLAFGVGTLSNLLTMSGSVGWLRDLPCHRWARGAADVAIAGFGTWGLVHTIWLPEMLSAHGFCLVL